MPPRFIFVVPLRERLWRFLSPDTFAILCIEFEDRHGKEVRLKMLERMFKAGGFVRGLIAKIPYLGVIKTVKTSTFTYILAGSLAFVICVIFACLLRTIVKKLKYRCIKKFFGISDLSGFKVKRMGRAGTKYYMEDGVNEFRLGIPQRKGKSKFVKQDSILWLIAGQKTYVLITKDPFAMIHLVHQLRETGLDIPPCDQELEKQRKIEESQKGMDETICDTIQDMADETAFTELCRQRLTIHGFVVADAPRNDDGISLFVNHRDQPKMIKCLLVDRDVLVSTEEIENFKDSMQKLFVEAGILITTGKVSVAAVSLAKANNIEIIFNEKLVDLFYVSKEIPANKQYLRWELKPEDLYELLPDGAVEKFF